MLAACLAASLQLESPNMSHAALEPRWDFLPDVAAIPVLLGENAPIVGAEIVERRGNRLVSVAVKAEASHHAGMMEDSDDYVYSAVGAFAT